MRYLIAAVVFFAAIPAGEATPPSKAQCKSRCQTQYEFCLKRSLTKRAKASCKLDRNRCHGTCPK
jgi:hypothetical protein